MVQTRIHLRLLAFSIFAFSLVRLLSRSDLPISGPGFDTINVLAVLETLNIPTILDALVSLPASILGDKAFKIVFVGGVILLLPFILELIAAILLFNIAVTFVLAVASVLVGIFGLLTSMILILALGAWAIVHEFSQWAEAEVAARNYEEKA